MPNCFYSYPLVLSDGFYYTGHQKQIQGKALLQAEKLIIFYIKDIDRTVWE